MNHEARTPVRSAGYDKKLEHVLEAAARVFAREGYGQSTIRQVAREADMSLAGLYHYFGSKEELLFILQFHVFDSILADLKRQLEGVTDPRERLRILVGNHLGHFVSRMDRLKVLAHELESLDGEYYDQVGELRRDYFRIALDIVEAIATLKGGSSVEPRVATLYLFGMLNWIYMWYPSEGGLTGDMLTQRLIVLFLEGFLPRG